MDASALLLLPLLITAAASITSFRYKTAGSWHGSSDHEGRIDLLGIDEIKLLPSSITNCSDGIRGLHGRLRGLLLCQDLLRASVVIYCVSNEVNIEHRSVRKGLQRLKLACNNEASEKHYYVSLSAVLECEGYDYPTDILRDSRRCSLSVTTRDDVGYTMCELLQLGFSATYLMMYLITLCIRSRHLRWTRVRRQLLLCTAICFSWIPLQAIGYITDSSTFLLIQLSVIWFACTTCYLFWSIKAMH